MSKVIHSIQQKKLFQNNGLQVPKMSFKPRSPRVHKDGLLKHHPPNHQT